MSLTGCGSVRSVQPLVSGYEAVTYTQNSISEPSAHQISLQYRKPNGGLMMIWPSAGGTIVRNDVAVFVGDKAWKQPAFGERWPMKPRLFVVRAPDLPLDITDEVIGRWAQASGKDVVKALKAATALGSQLQNDKVNFDFEFFDQPETTITLDWNQISDIMREVKEKGVVRNDLRWGTSYIEKEFKPEVQK